MLESLQLNEKPLDMQPQDLPDSLGRPWIVQNRRDVSQGVRSHRERKHCTATARVGPAPTRVFVYLADVAKVWFPNINVGKSLVCGHAASSDRRR